MSIPKYAITRQGYELLSSLANTDGKTFKITCAKCSDKPTDGELEEQTALVNPIHELSIVEASGNSNTSTLRLRLEGKNIAEAFNMYQIGIYAKAYEGAEDPNPTDKGVLLQIWQFDPPDTIGSGTSFVKEYIVTVALATADNIVINTDSGAYVPFSEFEKLNHKNYICTINHNMDKYPMALLMRHFDAFGMNEFGIGIFGGSDCEQLPVKLVYKDKNTIDVYSTNAVALLGTPEIIKHGNNMYHLNYNDANATTITLILN